MTKNQSEASYDVVVIGSGISGCGAALAAAEQGMKVLMLEKADKLGGGSSCAYGGLWVGQNHIAAGQGIKDDRDDVIDYMRFVGGDQIKEENMLAYVDKSPEALKFFEKCGVEFKIIRGFPDHYIGTLDSAMRDGRNLEVELISLNDLPEEWRDKILFPPNHPSSMTIEEMVDWGGFTNHAGWDKDVIEKRQAENIVGGGVGLITHFVKQYLARGGEARVSCGVDRLVLDDERNVTGVVTLSGEEILVKRGVVIATGGFESNPDLVNTYEQLPGYYSMMPPSITGDGMIMGTEIGGSVKIVHNNLGLSLGYIVPSDNPDEPPYFMATGIQELFCPHTMVVNGDGKRFGDEAFFQTVTHKVRDFDVARHVNPNAPSYLIFDSSYVEKFSFAGRPIGAEVPDWVASDDTLEGLADKLKIDKKGFKSTIKRFNKFAQEGVDEDFGRGQKEWAIAKRDRFSNHANPSLGEIAQAPYYGVELHPATFGTAGLQINASAQVIHARGHPISGLYACGNASAHTDYGVGYQAGYSLTSGFTFGYIAASHMASMAT